MFKKYYYIKTQEVKGNITNVYSYIVRAKNPMKAVESLSEDELVLEIKVIK